MNDELPDGPEYVFAQAVIDRLAGKKELANYVIPDPFDASDQVNNLALAVAQYDAAIAVMPQAPQPPPWKGVDMPDPGVVVATAAILVMTTGQVGADPTIRRLSALTAAVLRRLLGGGNYRTKHGTSAGTEERGRQSDFPLDPRKPEPIATTWQRQKKNRRPRHPPRGKQASAARPSRNW